MRPTRRNFLKQTCGLAAAAFAAPAVLRTSVFGANAPSNRVTVGMIGVGRQALQVNMKGFLHESDVQVIAVCDVDAWRLQNAKDAVEKHYASKKDATTSCATFRDFQELLARPDIDAVMISTPDHWHIPMSIAALKAGKDVSCEKPLTVSIREGRVLCDTVARYGRVFRTDSEFRSIASLHRACELVVNGRIGKLHTIRTGVPSGDKAGPPQKTEPVPAELDYERWLGPAPVAPYAVERVHPQKKYDRPGWMRVRDYCDGMICNWGTHLNDLAQWGNGTERTGPVEIEGTGTYPKDGLWDVLIAFDVKYRYANGVNLHYTYSRPYVRFEGDDGWIEAPYNGQLSASRESILLSAIGPNEIHLPRKTDKRDFIDAVKSRENTMEDAEVGHRTTSVCHLGHIAIQLGRKLKWDPVKEVFPDDPEANRMLDKPRRAPWTI